MSKNVSAAIPILKALEFGSWASLDAEAAEIIIRWIAQFTMTYEFADRETARIPQAVRSEFSRTNQLDGHWLIAIGVSQLLSAEQALHRGMTLMTADGAERPAQATAIVFGRLFCFSYYADYPVSEEVRKVVTDMRLTIIYPDRPKKFEYPTWQHTDESVPIIIEGVSEALFRLTKGS